MPRARSTHWTRLTLEERNALVRRAREGRRSALDRLVRLYRPMVRSIARRYEGRGLPREDLESDGVLGLLRAIPEFDPARGVDFRPFASLRIRWAILSGLAEEARLVRLPRNLADRVPRVRRAIDALGTALERPPSVDEVLDEVRARQEESAAAALPRRPGRAPAGEGARVTYGMVAHIMGYLESFPPERPLRSIRREEALPPDRHEEDPEARLEAAERSRAVQCALRELDPRESRVLRLRWGIAEGPIGVPGEVTGARAKEGRKRTLREVSEVLLLSKARVQFLEEQGYRRLGFLLGIRHGWEM